MVLADLGRRIAETFQKLSTRSNIDEGEVDSLLNDVCAALKSADVNNRFVKKFKDKVRNTFRAQILNGESGNKHQLIKSIVFNELVKLVDPGVKTWQPVKGQSNVIMFVGLQGSGKTTTVTKLAHYYQKKGWKTCMICADTYRAGAYDQLKQNATKARIPYYGSYTASDPVQIAQEGVEKFKSENFEIILIDTSGRHQQDEALFEEMLQISNVIHPENIIYVMDATNGQSCESHARAFKSKVDVASVVITKLDGHAKGGGAISAVAATRSPIIFVGTGEHLDNFEVFKVHNFVKKMLGMGDIEGLLDRMSDTHIDNKEELADRFQRGLFTLRDLYEYFQLIQKLGPLGQIIRSIPNLGLHVSADEEQGIGDMMRRCLVILDSMSSSELDSTSGVELFQNNPNRRLRVARGAGARPEEVDNVLRFHQTAAPTIKRLSVFLRGGGFGNLFSSLSAQPTPSADGNSNAVQRAPDGANALPSLDPSSLFSMLGSPFPPSSLQMNGTRTNNSAVEVIAANGCPSMQPINGDTEMTEFDLD